ncbi:MAG: YqeG family HAD IIIA-type phosphatase [Clostridiales bacterium]|nr:YqeG family HAD IIIA-type phosphatase [Clostridiales bacterium]
MNIFKAMKPEKVYESLVLIPWGELAGSGITTALLDFDNTLGPDHATEPESYSYRCVRMIEEQGIRCCLVSNAKSGRSAKIAEMLGIPVVTYANKPGTSGIFRAIELMKTTPDKCVMVGDQVFTDVIAGNRAGVRTFMVEKLHKPEIWYVMLKRPFEMIVRFFGKF